VCLCGQRNAEWFAWPFVLQAPGNLIQSVEQIRIAVISRRVVGPLRQDLEGQIESFQHPAVDKVPLRIADRLVEQVAHAIDEYHRRAFDLVELTLGLDAAIDDGAVPPTIGHDGRVASDVIQANRHALRIAVPTPIADLRAAREGIDGVLRPLDPRLAHGLTSSLVARDSSPLSRGSKPPLHATWFGARLG